MASELSVVIPSVNGAGDLMPCLEALAAAGREVAIEPIVIDRCGAALRSEIARRYPEVRVIAVDAGTSIPDMRAVGFRAATGESIAVIEDHVQVPEDWARRLIAAQRAGDLVVGGSVDNAATNRIVDWAAFLCEYSHLLPPLPPGRAQWLAGNNVAYRRSVIERYRQEIAAGRWEDHLHAAIKRDGIPLTCHPEIAVRHKKHYTVSEYMQQRFLYARSFAGARVHARSAAERMAYAVAALGLAPVLLARIVWRIGSRPAYWRPFIPALPLIVLFVVGWSAGEVVGYAAGAGDSLARVC